MDDIQKIKSLLDDILSRLDDIEKSLDELKKENSESQERIEHEIDSIKTIVSQL